MAVFDANNNSSKLKFKIGQGYIGNKNTESEPIDLSECKNILSVQITQLKTDSYVNALAYSLDSNGKMTVYSKEAADPGRVYFTYLITYTD